MIVNEKEGREDVEVESDVIVADVHGTKGDDVPFLPAPERDDDPNFNSMAYSEYTIPETPDSFWNLFPSKCVSGETIRDLVRFGENKYEKAMGICMAVILAATYNPVMHMAYAMAFSNINRLMFSFGLAIVFVVSWLAFRNSHLLAVVGFITGVKLFVFWEGAADALITLAMFLLIYLLRRIKNRQM